MTPSGTDDSGVQFAVIGRGMIGSAAARHLAEAGLSVVLAGPGEPAPEDRQRWTGPFASHFDEGRITRIGDADPVWAAVAARSIERYPDIEQRSGIRFHHRCGLLVASPALDHWMEAGPAHGAAIERLDPVEVVNRTGITLAAGIDSALEGPPAGHINPRRLVEAQTVLAEAAGAVVIDHPVLTLEPSAGRFELGGSWGTLVADRVLVATGAFANHLVDRRVPTVRKPRTVLLVELDLDAEDGVDPSIPSLILGPAPDSRLESIYWVPPVRFPDGRMMLKIGGAPHPDDDPVIGSGPDGDEELIRWFRSDGDPDEADALAACVASLLPGHSVRSMATSPCVLTTTPSGYPVIDWLEPGLAVAIGGNGSAAKSSDELGRLAAQLVTDGVAANRSAPGLDAHYSLAANVS